MKHVKKLASLLLALVMVLSLSATAFAAGETGTITVDNPIAGQTYTAYKIFDVVYDTNEDGAAGEHYSYTISGTSEWFNVVAALNDDDTVTSKITGLTFEKAYSEDTYVVIQGAGFSAAEFAKTLKAAVTGKTGTKLTAQADGTVSATDLALGYYFVMSSTGALCNLTTTNPTQTIHDKNDNPFDKVDDKESADVGETVTYTITGKVPDTTGFNTYTYKITDTMSSGLTFNKDVKVFIGGTEIGAETVATWITYTPNETTITGFELTIPVMDYQDQVGAEIKVTYTADVNENAIAKIEKNHAVLEYSNDPTNEESKTTTPPEEEEVYSSKIVIDKYDANNEETKLAGATFVLYKEVTTGEGDAAVTSKMYYKWNETIKEVEWVADKAQATSKTTDDKGAASFDGLANGIYYLEETKAPAGYNLLNAPVAVEVKGGTTEAQLTVTAKVANNTGSELPETGGMGTTIFYVLGSILVLGAAVLLITKKRMNAAA